MVRSSALRLSGAILLLLAAQSAFAADWVETPFNPPVGSRWVISSEQNDVDQRGDVTRTTSITMKSDLTFDAKTDDGYRVTYVTRELVMDGNAPGIAITAKAFDVLRGLVIRAKTDRQGKPLEVENLDEVKANIRTAIDRMTGAFGDNQQMAKVMRDMLNQFMVLDGAAAAENYLEQLSPLAKAHNTGLKLGELRRATEEKPSPIGGGTLKSTSTFELVAADPATGRASFVHSQTLDPAAVKEMATKLGRQIVDAAGNKPGFTAADFERVMGMISLSIEDSARYEVESGMTRSIKETGVTKASAMGQTFTKTSQKTITVTPAP